MEYKIEHLPKEKWKGHLIPIEYDTSEYYDFRQSNDGFDTLSYSNRDIENREIRFEMGCIIG